MDISEARQWTGSRRHPWELARARIIDSLLASPPERRIGRHSTVADIGCGDAYLIKRWSCRFPSALFAGIDTALTDDDTVRGSASVKLFSTFEQAAGIGEVSHVLLLDVLEHVGDERVLLQELTGSLSLTAATVFVVTVPAFQSLFSRHDISLGHYRRYSRKSLCLLLSEAGMEINKSGYFFSSLLIPRLAQCIGEKIFGSAGAMQNQLLRGAGLWRVCGWVIEQFLVADYRCGALLRRIGLRLPGLSVFAICTKPV